MINIEFLTKQIESIDVKSDEFFELYKIVSDKYWTFEDPDEYQKAAKLLIMYTERGENYEEQVITIVKLITELFNMEKENRTASMGHVGFKKKNYFFTLATDKKHINKMQEIMGKVLKGDFNIKE